jgi:acyl-CoA synthetase (AMP-forming)/AMP-acid ligase II
MAGGVKAGAAPEVRFQGMAESIAPMCFQLLTDLARLTAFRSGPDQVLKRAGRKHAYSSSRRVPAGYSSIGLVATSGIPDVSSGQRGKEQCVRW